MSYRRKLEDIDEVGVYSRSNTKYSRKQSNQDPKEPNGINISINGDGVSKILSFASEVLGVFFSKNKEIVKSHRVKNQDRERRHCEYDEDVNERKRERMRENKNRRKGRR